MIELKTQHPLIDFWREGSRYHLDVRMLLEEGGEPFSYIMECVNQVGADSVLVVHALFEPKPLIQLVRDMGLRTEVERNAEEHWTLIISQSDGEGP